MALLSKLRDSVSQSLLLFIPDASNPESGKTGLLPASVTLQTMRIDAAGKPLATPTTQTLAALISLTATYSANGWYEVGRGLYRWDPPDTLLQSGAQDLVLLLSGTDMVDTVVIVPLPLFDPLAAPLTDGQVADKLLGRSLAGGADGGRTVRDALRASRNKYEITGTGTVRTLTCYAEDDTTVAFTASVTIGTDGRISTIDPA